VINSSQSATSRRRPAAAILIAMMVGLVACSSGDSTSTSDSTATPVSTSSTVESGAEATEPATATPESELTGSKSDDPTAIEPGTKLRLLTHGSFSVSDGLFDNFTLETGIDVEVVTGGDAGELVAKAALTSGSPDGDVLFGIDSTFLQRGLDAELFIPHSSPMLSAVPSELQLDPENRVTPIDYGDVCINYWIDSFERSC